MVKWNLNKQESKAMLVALQACALAQQCIELNAIISMLICAH